ncbi:hypothetical protein CUPS4244_08560 [Campylobacter upsaliensis]|uniref:hypothetical protein n=1 Tax=Campylobacter upsaliensis TaxID=28080 RepID=UPI002149A78E|nr:hypothetical protein [Campylobacter upsaliensis]MCR2105124.1 hypothetical protein [Campylobacter upsaliensis]
MEKEFRKIIARLLNNLIEKQELKEDNVEFLTEQTLKTDIKLKDIKDEQSFLSFFNAHFKECVKCEHYELDSHFNAHCDLCETCEEETKEAIFISEYEPLIYTYIKQLKKEGEIKDTNFTKYLINAIYNHTSINEDDLKDKKSFLNFLKLNFCTCEGCGNLETYTINNFCTTCIEFITTHKEA